MSNKQIRIVIVYLLMFGLCTFAIGRRIGVEQQINKYEELKAINNNLYNVIQKKDSSYDELLQQTIEYKWLYESCQTMFGDYQDKVEAGCFLNGGWNCE